MSKRMIVAILCSLFSVSAIQAQTTFGWNFGTTTGTASATSGSNPLLTVSPITRVNSAYTGAPLSNTTTTGGVSTPLSNNAGASGQFFFGLGATETTLNINTTSYLSMTITPAAGYSVRLTDLDFGARASSLGATNYAIRTSVAGFGTAITNGSGTLQDDGTWRRINTTSLAAVNGAINTPVEIRLYLWDSSAGTTGTLDTQIDDVAASLAPVPEPASIIGLSAFGVFGFGLIRKRLKKS